MKKRKSKILYFLYSFFLPIAGSIKKEFLAKFTHLEKKYEQAEAGDRCLRGKIMAAYIRLTLKHVQTKIGQYVKKGWITPDAAGLLNADIEDILSFIKEE